MQAVVYVAGPVTVQLRPNVIPRSAPTSAGVNFTSARPFPVLFVVSVAVGSAAVVPVQLRLAGKMFRR